MPLPAKARKLLTLALDSAAADGEWKNAATMFIGMLRRSGVTPGDLLTPLPTPAAFWQPPARSRWKKRQATMPFGRFKGEPLAEVPTDYLQWLLSLDDLRPELRSAVMAELKTR